MKRLATTGFDELPELLRQHGPRDLVDLYLERRVEVTWRIANGRVTAKEQVLREGAAVRTGNQLRSTDGLERVTVAELINVPIGSLPRMSLPAPPPPPDGETVLMEMGILESRVRWAWRRAIVIRPDGVAPITHPELCDIILPDGHHALTVWPPAKGFCASVRPAKSAAKPRSGKVRVLLAPSAAATLIHELFGHPLEAELLLSGASPWCGRQGETVVSLDLDVDDDPTVSQLPGSFDVDDEGVPARPRRLLSRGVLVGGLADRAHSSAIGADPGNARRASVHTHPRARVANLIARAHTVLPRPPQDAARIQVESVDFGTIEPRLSLVILQVRSAFALHHGERGEALPPFTLVGEIGAVCRGLLAAAGDGEATAEPGWCGKDGDLIPTGSIAPWLLVDGLEVR